jgi:Tfp pilus assembly protein PilF
MKDRAVFIPRPDPEYSQLFFPVQGLLSCFDRETGAIDLLPGAGDEAYVQSNAAWTPDGRFVTFARAPAAVLTTTTRNHVASLSPAEVAEVVGGEEYMNESKPGYTKFLFDLYTVPFNGGQGGEPVPVEGASGNGKSNYFPKYSPNGKWLVFDQAESFMLLMPDSRLYIMPADGGEPRLMNCNTESMNSWHSWSPNLRWLVFTSKLFSPYTQLFLTHVDENGIDTPPVLLESSQTPERAANIPEFVNIEPGCKRLIVERFVNDDTYFQHGLRMEEFGRLEEAQGQYLEALRLNPENSAARLALALTYARQRDLQEAVETAQVVPEGDPLFGRAVYFQGGINAEQGLFPAAVEAYLRSLSIGFPDPYFEANVQLDLGTCLMMMDDNEAAEEAFRTAFRIDPERYEALINLGNIKLRRDDLAGALSEFEHLLELAPNIEGLRERIGEPRA